MQSHFNILTFVKVKMSQRSNLAAILNIYFGDHFGFVFGTVAQIINYISIVLYSACYRPILPLPPKQVYIQNMCQENTKS